MSWYDCKEFHVKCDECGVVLAYAKFGGEDDEYEHYCQTCWSKSNRLEHDFTKDCDVCKQPRPSHYCEAKSEQITTFECWECHKNHGGI